MAKIGKIILVILEVSYPECEFYIILYIIWDILINLDTY